MLCSLFGGLGGLVVFCGLITAVVWLFVMAVRKLASQGRAQIKPATFANGTRAIRRCVGCGHGLDRDKICSSCGMDCGTPAAGQVLDLVVTARQIERLASAGRVTIECENETLRAIGELRAELLESLKWKPREPAPVPAAVAAPSPPAAAEQIPLVLPARPVEKVPVVVAAVRKIEREPVVVVPARPRRTLAEMTASFMEASNILWGEVVGGLLIVGCSIALVISLRETLQQIPYFPFLVLAAVTAALMGAGRYTLSHWKLESTSRGLLAIGTLLVPLCFLVLAGLAQGRQGGALELATELGAIGLFLFLVRDATRTLLAGAIGEASPHADWLTTAAILGASASMLLVPHIDEFDQSGGKVGLVGYVPALALVLTQALAWRRSAGSAGARPRQLGGLFFALGLSAYAVLVAFGALVFRAHAINLALEYLAAPMALVGVTPLLAGAVARQKLQDSSEAASEPGISAGMAGLIATLLSLGGALLMVLALGAAWPIPIRLTVIAAANAAALAYVASRFRMPPAYVAAQLCLAVAALIGWQWGTLALDLDAAEMGPALLGRLMHAESGAVLLVVAASLAFASEWQARRGRPVDSQFQIGGAGALAIVSMLWVLAGIDHSAARTALVLGTIGATALAVNLRWRQAWLSGTAICLLGAAIFFTFDAIGGDALLSRKLVQSALASAVLALAIDGLGRLTWVRRDGQRGVVWDQAFTVPLGHTALGLCVCGLCFLPLALRWDWLGESALVLAGLSAVLAVLAWQRRDAVLFAMFQAGLAGAVVLGVTAGLSTAAWFSPRLPDLVRDARVWQAWGMGLSALVVAWTSIRLRLRTNDNARALLEPGWLPFDRLLLGGLVIASLTVAIFGAAPGVAAEMAPLGSRIREATDLHVADPMAWCWLGTTATALILLLWQRRIGSALVGLVLLAICVPVMAATTFQAEIAVASALRWGLAPAFVALSGLIWARQSLTRLAARVGIDGLPGKSVFDQILGILLAGTAAPVLLLSMILAAQGFNRIQPAGPLEGSLFHGAGTVIRTLVPLALICLGLAGHGIRQRSAIFAFSGGIVALASVVAGHALGIVESGAAIGSVEIVQLGQLATSVLGAWLLGWLALQHWPGMRSATSDQAGPSAWSCAAALLTQEVLIWSSYLGWLVPGLLEMAFPGWSHPMRLPNAGLVMECGAWLGWSALGLATAATFLRRHEQGQRLPSWWIAATACLVGIVSCSTVAFLWPGEEERELLVVAAGLTLTAAITLVAWASGKRPAWLQTSPDAWAEQAWVAGLGVATIVLALQRGFFMDDFFWAAAAVGFVAVAGFLTAVLRRMESWVFAGGLALQLAVSLALFGFYLPDTEMQFANWWVKLLQANLGASGAVGIIWMANRKLFRAGEVAGAELSWWVRVQYAFLTFGNSILGLVAFVLILRSGQPSSEHHLLGEMGGFGGYLALLPAAVGLLWMVWVFAPRQAIDALVGVGWLFCVLVASTMARFDVDGTMEWLAYHTLTGCWLILTAAVLTAGWMTEEMARGPAGGWAEQLSQRMPRRAVTGWVAALGIALALLVNAHSITDPLRPIWPCGLILAVAGMMGAMAIWTGRERFVVGSGLLLNFAGLAFWAESLGRGQGTLSAFLLDRLWLIQASCLALGSLIWSCVKLRLRRWHPTALADHASLSYRHLVPWLALGMLTLRLAFVWIGPEFDARGLEWMVLAELGLAACLMLWDERVHALANPWLQLYLLGLVGMAMGLQGLALEPVWLAWSSGLLLAGYVLAASSVSSLESRWQSWRARLEIAPNYWPIDWFIPLQAGLGLAALVLGLWMTGGFAESIYRLGGCVAALMVASAWVLLALQAPRSGTASAAWLSRLTALLLGAVACIYLHLALVPLPAPLDHALLNASVNIMLALVLMSGIYGILVGRLMRPGSEWEALARRLSGELGKAAGGVLALVFAQEFRLFDPVSRTTPLSAPGIWLVALALVALFAGALKRGLAAAGTYRSERSRKGYVYIAEILVVLVVLHLRLNVPALFPQLSSATWVLLVMVLAFLGLGLSAWCKWRGIQVLAEPLENAAMFLPVVPLLAFLIRPLGLLTIEETGNLGGLHLLPYYLKMLPDDYRVHAGVWLGMGMLYLAVSMTRRSSWLGITAAVLANFGIWVVLAHQSELAFWIHPQLWLAPVGLIVLCAERMNRDRLESSQRMLVRYTGLLLIYISSSADMFIEGVGNNPVLPIALALLSVAGVLVGIMLQVRAYLVTGIAFLFLVIFAQIWHAAVDLNHTWVWWASGIVLGAAILAMFAWFEKRRNDVIGLIDQFKQWQ